MIAAIALYALARIGVVAVVAGLLVVAGVPLAVAVLVGLIVALPLSMVLFRGLRTRLDTALRQATARRSVERDALRAGLRGEAVPDEESGDRAQSEPDGGQDRPGEQQ